MVLFRITVGWGLWLFPEFLLRNGEELLLLHPLKEPVKVKCTAQKSFFKILISLFLDMYGTQYIWYLWDFK